MRAALKQAPWALDRLATALAVAGAAAVLVGLALARALVWLVRVSVDASPSALLGRGYTDRPFRGPFVAIHVSPPKRPKPYDWARQDNSQDAQ